MIIFRKRLVVWLIKEYLKKWGKIIPIYLILGILFFFLIRFLIGFLMPRLPIGQHEYIGVAGAYTLDKLPTIILNEISSGLTIVANDGVPKPSIAKYWKIQDSGKTYVFYLKDDIYFNDGTNLTSDHINYNFSDVTVVRPNKFVVVYKLKSSYSPFLVTVSRPIFKKNLIGTGEYKVKNIKLNGDFVQSITLVSKNNKYQAKTYQFYSSEDILKTAYLLGEVTQITGLSGVDFKENDLKKFPNTYFQKSIDYSTLVTLFYNTQDNVLSDKKIRNALSYAIPDSFSEGERSYAPYPKTLWAYQEDLGIYDKYLQDLAHAKLLLSNSDISTKSGNLTVELKTMQKYKSTAERIRDEWKKIGINTKIKLVTTLPSSFQIFLGDFNVPRDPDQYVLWHSSQPSNITNYNKQRIDKFLEDGRKTIEISERKKIYADFQKYLLDDSPASFLYFPNQYQIKRR